MPPMCQTHTAGQLVTWAVRKLSTDTRSTWQMSINCISVNNNILHSVIFSFLGNWVPGSKKNNNNSHDNVYGAVIMTQSHCESSPGSSDECRLSAGWPPTLKPSQSTWAVSPPKIGSYHPHPPHHCYYYSARRLILILPSHEGWKAEST